MADFIYGIHPVREGLSGRRQPLELFVEETAKRERLAELLELAAERGVPVRRRSRADLDRLAGNGHHQGAVLRMEDFPYAELEDLLGLWRQSERPALFVLLDGITDPHNLGAILRNADAAGCHGVILPKDRSCGVTNVVIRASAGAAEHLPVCQVTNLARTMQQLQAAGVWIYGLAAGDASAPLYGTDVRGDVALVVGSEGEGLRQRTRELCDHLVEIPMAGKVASLNAASAAAVALFEVVRQRTLKG